MQDRCKHCRWAKFVINKPILEEGGIWFNGFNCLASKGRKGGLVWSVALPYVLSLSHPCPPELHCCTSYPCPIFCPPHNPISLPQWPLQCRSGQSTFALPPPPAVQWAKHQCHRHLPVSSVFPPSPDPGYILTRHGLTLVMSRTGPNGGHLILDRFPTK